MANPLDSADPLGDDVRASRSAKPCVLVIFGATGDLTKRKLVPSLMGLAKDELLPSGFAVVGFARRPWTDESFREVLKDGVEQFGRSDTMAAWEQHAQAFSYHQSDFANEEGYATLREKLDQIDRERGTQGNRIFYLATPPSAYSTHPARI